MKMWKGKTWQPETTGVDGNTILFGVNIFQYPWADTGRRIRIRDIPYALPVFVVTISGAQYEFAANERSNCVWDFYLYKY